MRRHVLVFGLVGGFCVAALRAIEYRWLVVDHSVELSGGLVALLFASLGIWLGCGSPGHGLRCAPCASLRQRRASSCAMMPSGRRWG